MQGLSVPHFSIFSISFQLILSGEYQKHFDFDLNFKQALWYIATEEGSMYLKAFVRMSK